MSDHLRNAIRDGRMLRDGRQSISRAATRAEATAALEHAADELEAGRIPPGVIVCRRGSR